MTTHLRKKEENVVTNMATKCLNKQKLHIQRRIFSYIEIIERQLLKPTSKNPTIERPLDA